MTGVGAARTMATWAVVRARTSSALSWAWATPRPGVHLITTVFKIVAALERDREVVPGVEDQQDLVYGAGNAERLDLYRPADHDGQRLPLVVWLHGGAWIGGDKARIGFYLRALAAAGYVCAGVNYSLAPDNHYPESLRETGRALKWLIEHAGGHGIDPDRIVLAGDSAGAQIAGQYAALVTDPVYAADVGVVPAITAGQLLGTVLHCGPYDPPTALRATGWRGWYARTVGWAYLGTKDVTAAQVQQASIVRHATAAFPPTLLTGGDRDLLSPQGHALAARLAELGVEHQPHWYPDLDHQFQFDLYRPEAQQVLADTVGFLQARTGPVQSPWPAGEGGG